MKLIAIFTWSWDTISSSLTLEDNDTSELTITQMDELQSSP